MVNGDGERGGGHLEKGVIVLTLFDQDQKGWGGWQCCLWWGLCVLSLEGRDLPMIPQSFVYICVFIACAQVDLMMANRPKRVIPCT